MAADNTIGRIHCPVCRSDRASLRVSAKNLAYVICNRCNFQGMARSDHSDELLRAMVIAEAKPAPEPDPAPTPEPTPERLPAMSGWGVLGHG